VEDNQAPDTLEAVLAHLQAAEPLEDRNYGALSDLSAADVEQVRAAWLTIPPGLREETLSHAAGLAEERIDLEFAPLARIGLSDPEAEVRISALEAVGDSTSRPLGAQLQKMLDTDEDGRVRAAVAAVLRQFVMAYEFDQFPAGQGEAIVASLRARLNDPSEELLVRALSLEALGPHSAPWMPAAIEHAYASDEREMRLAAVRAMADSCDDRWLDYVFEQGESEDPEFRYEAAVAAGAIGSTDAVEPIAQLLLDDDPRVLLAAIEALGEIGGAAALEELRAFAPHAPEGTETSLENAISAASEIASLEEDDAEDGD
jgi:HEAT repeat protein